MKTSQKISKVKKIVKNYFNNVFCEYHIAQAADMIDEILTPKEMSKLLNTK